MIQVRIDYKAEDLLSEAQKALEKVWFVQSVVTVERTDFTLSLRLTIGPDLFVQAFLGELTGALYFALIERGQRIFGIDRESGRWHEHPYEAPHRHTPLPEGLEPKPLLKFLSRLENFRLEADFL